MQRAARTTAQEEALERFFPGCFDILLPVVTSAIPHIIQAFRDENAARDVADRQSDEAIERFLPELLSIAGPLLSQLVPVVIEQVQGLGQQRAQAGDAVVDDEALERFLPELLGAVVPEIVTALPTIIQGASWLFAGSRDAEIPLPVVVDTEVSQRFLGPLLQAVVPAIAANLPQLVQLVTGMGSRTSRDVGVGWHDFVETNRLWDRDNIAVTLTPIGDPNVVEIGLRLAPHKTWWKGIQVQDDNGEYIAEIGVQDNNKYASVRVNAQDILDPGGYLLFMKAKMFGVHTGMYRLPTAGLNQLRGHRADFYWYAD